MTKTYNWTTPRGAAIQATISVEHITRETISADGCPVEVSCDRWQRTVDSMTVNGQPTELKELYTEGNKQCILIKCVGNDRLLVALPSDVEDDIYGEERRSNEAKAAIRAEEDAKYEAHREMMRKAMDDDSEPYDGEPIVKTSDVDFGANDPEYKPFRLDVDELSRLATADLSRTSSRCSYSAGGDELYIESRDSKHWVRTSGGLYYRCSDAEDAERLAARIADAWSKGDYSIEGTADIVARKDL